MLDRIAGKQLPNVDAAVDLIAGSMLGGRVVHSRPLEFAAENYDAAIRARRGTARAP